MDTIDEPPSHAPPPPPKRLSRPKITLQMPDTPTPISFRGPPTASLYWGPSNQRYSMRPPGTAVSHSTDPSVNPYFNPLVHMYHSKAQEFMFKQFAGFKDFTMNTAKSGLSAGEKTAFWLYNKLSTLSKKWFTHLFLTLCLVLYSGLGALVFMAVEGSNETASEMRLKDIRKDAAFAIHGVMHNETLMAQGLEKIIEGVQRSLKDYEDKYGVCSKYFNCMHNNNDTTWTFWNSMFYAGTIYTTIGYGHIAPKTTSGRVATIVYAIVGIPLFLIVLADFGKLFTRIIKFFWAFIRRFYYTRSCRKVRRTVPMQEVMKGLNIMYDAVRRPSQLFYEDEILKDDIPPPIERKSSDDPPPLPPKPNVLRDPEIRTEPETPAPSVFEIDDEFNLPISVAIVILIIYIIIGATAYSLWEPWSFFESFYFVFISMSTIGLGDLVPNHPMFMIASILYLVFGLALTSMCINVVQVKLSDTFRHASAKLGATIGLKVAEEDGSLVSDTPKPIEIVPVHKPTSETKEHKADTDDDDAKNR